MSVVRAVICVLLPPLAVLDKGCGSVLMVFILTLFGWVPGIVGAMVICMLDQAGERYVFVDESKRGGGEVIDVKATEVGRASSSPVESRNGGE